MNAIKLTAILALGAFGAATAGAQDQTVPVTRDNFVRAESDMYMGKQVQEGNFGKLGHRREPASIDNQSVIRLNRDTLYSSGVFDLDAGPVTVVMPDPGGRFMSLMTVNEDHYATNATYGAGSHTFDKDKIGTRYVLVGVRTLVDPNDPKDVAAVHALQDAIKVSQPATGTFETPKWDPVSQKQVRDELLKEAATKGDMKRAFGAKDAVDPQEHLIATAAGWGGNPPSDATYLMRTPAANDGKTVYKLIVKDVPVDGFWSVSVYNKDGYYEKNQYDAYSLNNVTAKKDADGSVAVQFGDCDGKVENCLPIMAGWNYTVRLYRPRAEILNGTWTFPEAQPVPVTARIAP
jgi:hypothetical protein